MDTLKAAVVGLGVMGRHHARVYQGLRSSIGAVIAIDPNGEPVEIGSSAPLCCWTDVDAGYEAMVDHGVQLASITCPTSLHAEMAIRAMELGIHVLVEKPIAHTAEDAQDMIACAKGYDRVLMVGHIVRYDPITDFIKGAIANGELGEIWRISARRIGPSPDRIRDVGVTVDLATHDIDAMRYVLGQDPREVAAMVRYRDHGEEYEDQVDGWIEFSGGATGIVEADWITPVKHRSMVVCGSKGMLIADYIERTAMKFRHYEYGDVAPTARWTFPKDAFREPLGMEIQAFVTCVMTGCNPPISGEDGLIALRTALAMVDSSSTVEPVQL